MTIYSFDDVLRQPKALHAIELTPGGATKIPLWRPVPYVSFFYFVVVELVFLIAAKLPVLEAFSQLLAPLVYYVVFPVGVVWLVMRVEFDGRPPHTWLLSYAFFLRRSKRMLAGRPVAAAGTRIEYAGRVKVWWDVHAPRLHHGWVRGGRISTSASTPVSFTYALTHRSRVMVPDDDHEFCSDHEVDGKLEIRP